MSHKTHELRTATVQVRILVQRFSARHQTRCDHVTDLPLSMPRDSIVLHVEYQRKDWTGPTVAMKCVSVDSVKNSNPSQLVNKGRRRHDGL